VQQNSRLGTKTGTVFRSQHIVLDMRRVYAQSTMSEMSLIYVHGEL
jgi:hypothetical protein